MGGSWSPEDRRKLVSSTQAGGPSGAGRVGPLEGSSWGVIRSRSLHRRAGGPAVQQLADCPACPEGGPASAHDSSLLSGPLVHKENPGSPWGRDLRGWLGQGLWHLSERRNRVWGSRYKFCFLRTQTSHVLLMGHSSEHPGEHRSDTAGSQSTDPLQAPSLIPYPSDRRLTP